MEDPSDSAAGVREGDILAGKYKVERVLGIGGMGVVVAAHHIQLDEKVALKFLLPEALGNAEAVARFAREARAAVKIKSEHVARVTDVGTLPNGAPYMVMEYLEGEDLAAWLAQKGPLPVEQAVEFVLQACIAVADAHALGIVHRDLKPANLFCIRRSDGQLSVKVLDFGISKMTDAAAGAGVAMTRTSALMGTPLYMSPEQMRSSRDVDAKTDIWALGAILFELMAGRPAFTAESVTELAIKVNNEPAPSIRGFRPEVTPELEAVIGKCLEKDREQRYRNVAELGLALLPFAPRRAKALVERISGIIQAAGLSTTALAVPQSPRTPPLDSRPRIDGRQPSEGAVSQGTLPPFGRTTLGATAGKKTVVGAGIAAGVVLLALVGTVAMSRARTAHRDDVAAAAAGPPGPAVAPDALPQPSPLPPPAIPAGVVALGTVDAPPEVPEARPAVAVLPTAAPAPKKLPGGHPATPVAAAPATPVAAAPATPVAAAPAKPVAAAPTKPTAAANCDPPYFFDAKGNRVFKPECL